MEILEAIDKPEMLGHSGYPNDIVNQMIRARVEESDVRYPREGVPRFEPRAATEGRILHPYAAR